MIKQPSNRSIQEIDLSSRCDVSTVSVEQVEMEEKESNR